MTDLPIADDGIYVASVGAQTPVGRSALQAAAAVRCGISAYAIDENRVIGQRLVDLADWS